MVPSIIPALTLQGSQKENRDRTVSQNIFVEITADNGPNLKKRNRYPGIRSTEDPKTDEPKKTQTKTYDN